MATKARNATPYISGQIVAHIYSTMTASQQYCEYDQTSVDDPNALPILIGSVFIKGGAGVARKTLVTPMGVKTEVDQDQLDLLERNFDFKRHIKDGWLKAVKTSVDVAKVVSDMNERDGSSPMVPADFEAAGGAKPQSATLPHDAEPPTTKVRSKPIAMPTSPFR